MLLLQSFTVALTATDVLGYASDVTSDMMPIAMAIMGVALGMRIYRSVKAG